MLPIALAVKMSSSGPVLFKQERYGYKRRTFKIIKFRTMRNGLPHGGPEHVVRKNDARVTWIGKYLRLTKLDELLQLWNLLRGDVTLVGPRPKPIQEFEALASANQLY